MAERKAVNKYYPPDWDPRKQGSVNKRVGQHPLRDRARKLSQGILVIRFELPYNIWCGGCGSHVGMGVRYNAEKSKVGNYYSTPIYKFRMKCHLCDNYFEIQTDPQNHDYVILSGARRKEQRWDPHDNGQIVPEDKATQKKLATDAMYKLEHGSDDKQKGSNKVASLAQIEESRISMVDDYLLNRMARDKFRTEKHELKAAAEADKALLEKGSLSIDLVEESEEDRRVAGLLKYSVTKSFEDKQIERRKSIEQRPLFDRHTGETSSLVLPHQRHTQPELSRRGQLKQKLGWALKASYTDPFKSESNKKSSLSSLSLKNQLGIKLKSPSETSKKGIGKRRSRECESVSESSSDIPCQTSLAQDGNNETSDVIQERSTHGEKNVTDNKSSNFQSACESRTSQSECLISSEHSSIVCNSAKDDLNNECESASTKQGNSEQLNTVHRSKMETVNIECESVSTPLGSRDAICDNISPENLNSSSSSSGVSCIDESNNNNDSIQGNVSGLSALMSNYTSNDSDSESSS